MAESNGTPEWFDDEPAAVEPDDDEETEQTWFNGLAFKPTPAGEAPDTDHDLGTYRPDTNGAEDIGLTVTNSARTEANSDVTQNGGTTDSTASDGSAEADPESDTPATAEEADPKSDTPATATEADPDRIAQTAESADETATTDRKEDTDARDSEESGGLIAWLKSLFGL